MVFGWLFCRFCINEFVGKVLKITFCLKLAILESFACGVWWLIGHNDQDVCTAGFETTCERIGHRFFQVLARALCRVFRSHFLGCTICF